MRTMGGKPADMFNPNCPTYAGFQSKLHAVKRMNPGDFRDNVESAFLKDLKELPPLHPSEVETVLGKKDRTLTPKVEPIFPPPPDPSCTIAARMPATNVSKSSSQRMRKGSVSFNPTGSSTTPSTSSFSQVSRSSALPAPNETYPYMDFRAKYDPNCYSGMPSAYNQFSLTGFAPDYNAFNAYAGSSGYASWASLGKYDQPAPNRVAQSSTSLPSITESTAAYRTYPTTATTSLDGAQNFAASLPFAHSFQNDNFMQSMQSYTAPLDPQQATYGMNLSTYNYPQATLPSTQPPAPPPNTTSYM